MVLVQIKLAHTTLPSDWNCTCSYHLQSLRRITPTHTYTYPAGPKHGGILVHMAGTHFAAEVRGVCHGYQVLKTGFNPYLQLPFKTK